MEIQLRRSLVALVALLLASACGGKSNSSAGSDPKNSQSGAGTGAATTRGGGSYGGASSGGAVSGGTSSVGTSSTSPATSNYLIQQNPPGGVDKVDILFTIDNSLSMADKQRILANGIPRLLSRLTNPDCVDSSGALASVHMDSPFSACPTGLVRESVPLKDIHLGVITSSLGDFGGDTCPEGNPGTANEAQNDHAWLLGALPRNAGKFSDGFLAWSADNAQNYASDSLARSEEFANFVMAATEIGCGFEMVLESWYRFLVDPNPPAEVRMVDSKANFRDGTDATILELRKRFLRPDSLLAILMLSDENDCSMKDSGSDAYSWVAMTASNGFRMWRGSSVCAQNPNDPCCFSCMIDIAASAQCKAKDPDCQQNGTGVRLAVANDNINVRCRQTKKRFGYDFLFPPARYVNALTKRRICPQQTYGDLDCDCAEAKSKGVPCSPGEPVANPLYVNLNPNYTPTGPERQGPEQVFLTGVVGVPWQDLAKDLSAVLTYKKATELDWSLFAPKLDEDYSVSMLRDPLMIESFSPRSGTHPITGEAVAGPDAGRLANSINGHEWNTSNRDVQYACIFSLDAELQVGQTAVHVCDREAECGPTEDTDKYRTCERRFNGCACTLIDTTTADKNPLDPTGSHSPLCQDAKGQYGNTQYFANAYPGLRELQVLRGFYEMTGTDNAVVGSICPKDLALTRQNEAGYGYNPAMDALTDRMRERLGAACLPRSLTVRADGTLACSVIEAISPSTRAAEPEWCDCAAHGRLTVSSEVASALRGEMQNQFICGAGPLPVCNDFCFCALPEIASGTVDGDRCRHELNVEKTTGVPGFCYVDPAQGQGSTSVVAACPTDQQRMIRVVGNATSSDKYQSAPAPGRVFIVCPKS